ncbi:hypothetical protein Q5H93_21855 [Hymenobacter sp. ASUV-10]|uniref:Uncharacterized protein n=1 Tax=Hymenobacter aranciens TaxID=3063996 RepID=A0ABT9BGK1_9BACT|nr:hypothetical protein [Hymenobacter sp. ASUV-10]MDO7877401.1 hypothetical protein [Hymenobacter sp. ASUV-10]
MLDNENLPGVAREDADEAAAQALAAQLATDPRYLRHLARYRPQDHAAFLLAYAQRIVHARRNGPYQLNFSLLDPSTNPGEAAYDWLFHIQQKKFFDLQVRWRAGEISLPGIYYEYQFEKWKQHLHACPWLPPITEAEYELFVDYLASGACRTVGFHPEHQLPVDDWQDYEAMRRHWQARQTGTAPDRHAQPYPEWYAYYDARTGAPAGYPFATHSNQRAEQHLHYRHLGIDHSLAQRWPDGPPPEYRDRRPSPSWPDGLDDTFATDPAERLLPDYDEAFYEFARRFDPGPGTARLRELTQALRRADYYGSSRVAECVHQSLDYLRKAELIWPTNGDDDWRRAIVEAAQHLHRQRLLAALPQAFADYRFRIDTGLQPAPPWSAFHWVPFPRNQEQECAPEADWFEDYLLGRELAGLPRVLEY